jgi:hypothetical protein
MLFRIEVRYNSEADLFTVSLYNNDNILLCIEPIIYGVELFKQHYKSGSYPAMRIVPTDESGGQDAVTWDNFNETVYLIIDNA